MNCGFLFYCSKFTAIHGNLHFSPRKGERTSNLHKVTVISAAKSVSCKVKVCGNIYIHLQFMLSMIVPYVLCMWSSSPVTKLTAHVKFNVTHLHKISTDEYFNFPTLVLYLLVGASLSEPHTSVTSLCPCVCMFACLLACLDRPLTVNHFRVV